MSLVQLIKSACRTVFGMDGPVFEPHWGRNFWEPSILVPGPTHPAVQCLQSVFLGVKLQGHDADFQLQGGVGVELHICISCVPTWHVTGNWYSCASSNLHVDLYVTNVAYIVLSQLISGLCLIFQCQC